MKNKILFCCKQRENYGWLSNFYPLEIEIEGVVYPTVEHYYQSEKTLIEEEKSKVISASSPKEAKNIGRRLTLRENWDKVKLDVMWRGLVAKFTQNEDLKKKLFDTKDAELVEDAWWDPVWGTGRDGKGKNILGVLLMRLRENLFEFRE